MPEISWVRGDTPLPLQTGMDLTGAEVTAFIHEADNPDATVYFFAYDITDMVAGDIEVVSSSIPVGRWELAVVAVNGETRSTFPNTGLGLILNVFTSATGTTPLPEDPEVILDGGAP